MGFFERISRSPSEKKFAESLKQQEKIQKHRQPIAREQLQLAMSVAIQTFRAAHEDQSWKTAASSALMARKVALDAQAIPEYALSAEMHAKALFHASLKDWDINPHSMTFNNLKNLWFLLIEDLEAVDTGARFAHVDPDSLSDILGLISELEVLMTDEYSKEQDFGYWIDSRKLTRMRVPVLPPLILK